MKWAVLRDTMGVVFNCRKESASQKSMKSNNGQLSKNKVVGILLPQTSLLFLDSGAAPRWLYALAMPPSPCLPHLVQPQRCVLGGSRRGDLSAALTKAPPRVGWGSFWSSNNCKCLRARRSSVGSVCQLRRVGQTPWKCPCAQCQHFLPTLPRTTGGFYLSVTLCYCNTQVKYYPGFPFSLWPLQMFLFHLCSKLFCSH